MLNILLSLLILSVLVLVHELGHFWAAKRSGVLVEEFGIGLPPRIVGKKIGETIYSVNLFPFGGFVRLLGENSEAETATAEAHAGRAFFNKKPAARFFILSAGVIMNFLFGFLLIWLMFIRGHEILLSGNVMPLPGTEKVVVLLLNKNSPAEQAGMKVGDKIAAMQISEQKYSITKLQQVIDFSKEFAGQEIGFNLERSSQVLEISVIPRVNPPPGEGALGIALGEVGMVKYGFFQSMFEAAKASVNTAGYIFLASGQVLRQIIFQQDLGNVAGPVGIINFAGSAISSGLNSTLNFIVMISLNLAVFNILPLPALDGGRIIFVIWEGLTKKPVSTRVEGLVHAAGMIFLLGLLLLITIVDIKKLI